MNDLYVALCLTILGIVFFLAQLYLATLAAGVLAVVFLLKAKI